MRKSAQTNPNKRPRGISHMFRIYLPMLALTAAALITFGCGNSGRPSTHQTTIATPSSTLVTSQSSLAKGAHPLTQAMLITRADTLCEQIATRRNLLKFGKSGTLVVILPQIAAYQQALFDGLRNLTPPVSMASEWNQIVADTQTLANSTAKLNHDAETNNARGATPLFTIFAQARLKLHADARRSGFITCAHY